MNQIQEDSIRDSLKSIIFIDEKSKMSLKEKEELINKNLLEFLEKNEIELWKILNIYKELCPEFLEKNFILFFLNHTHDEYFVEQIIKAIVSINVKKILKTNMALKEKEELINNLLLQFYKISWGNLKAYLHIFKEIYVDFSQEIFFVYVLNNISDINIIFNMKRIVEKELKEISGEIFEIDEKLEGYGGINATKELSEIDIKFNQLMQIQPMKEKINKIKSKYKLPIYKIKPKKDEILTDMQIQEYMDQISEMIKNHPNMEDLYKIAKEQITDFSGLGELYENELRKRVPQLFEYIDSLMKDELDLIMKEKQELIAKKQNLKEMEVKYKDILKKCDNKLPDEDKGTLEERNRRRCEKMIKNFLD